MSLRANPRVLLCVHRDNSFRERRDNSRSSNISRGGGSYSQAGRRQTRGGDIRGTPADRDSVNHSARFTNGNGRRNRDY